MTHLHGSRRPAMLRMASTTTARIRSAALLLALALPVQASAQDESADAKTAATESANQGVQVGLEIMALRERLDEQGIPVWDAEGRAVMIEVPVTEVKVMPGDELIYQISLSNSGSDAESIELKLPLSVELALAPKSLQSDLEVKFQASSIDSEEFFDIFADDQARELSEDYVNGAAKGLDGLRAKVARLPQDAIGGITYQVTVR